MSADRCLPCLPGGASYASATYLTAMSSPVELGYISKCAPRAPDLFPAFCQVAFGQRAMSSRKNLCLICFKQRDRDVTPPSKISTLPPLLPLLPDAGAWDPGLKFSSPVSIFSALDLGQIIVGAMQILVEDCLSSESVVRRTIQLGPLRVYSNISIGREKRTSPPSRGFLKAAYELRAPQRSMVCPDVFQFLDSVLRSPASLAQHHWHLHPKCCIPHSKVGRRGSHSSPLLHQLFSPPLSWIFERTPNPTLYCCLSGCLPVALVGSLLSYTSRMLRAAALAGYPRSLKKCGLTLGRWPAPLVGDILIPESSILKKACSST